jgi:hypothetical protein
MASSEVPAVIRMVGVVFNLGTSSVLVVVRPW